jgi:hypothetical protein
MVEQYTGFLMIAIPTTEEAAMMWVGSWRNQYGSMLEITSDANGRIDGSFQTAVDSSIKGQQVAVVGVHQGDLISFAVSGDAIVVSWTGLLHDDRIETLWHLVASEKLTADAEGAPARKKSLGVWEAITTSAGTFERIT